ncbi:hypothetical protein C4561_00660 [candidate division WWE3 bacterium]|jgi:F0F1-type ATP synthase gamma subunit|uniref:F0F1 ATP synthase subunit gamma n=1 Tax=candidate division WWE3 bacterium TaxID=2053526 RepID=A0A3A4ZG37_UNCKA|nr:MAG: hypothetical protein C4561_00660 [candidate division WWE3 bacterium]
MQNKKELLDEIATLTSLKNIVESYEEIAALRMRKVKKSVLQNREFLTGLDDLYQRVMFTYKSYIEQKKTDKDKKTWLPLNTNGKTVSVLISSNTGLYGEIIRTSFDYFIDNIRNKSTDVVICGRIGKQLYDSLISTGNSLPEYQFFDLQDSGVNQNELKKILDFILNYSNVVVYHGLYVSVLSQQPTATFVTGKALEVQSADKANELKCIIEPSVLEVTEFFEKQILSSIFEQSVYEASLSKFASRMVSLDLANENISEQIKKVNFKKLKVKHNDDNLQQIERLSGISLWS